MSDQQCICVICERCIDNRESSAVLFPKDEPRMSRWIRALKIRNVDKFIWKLKRRDIAFACYYHIAAFRRNHTKLNTKQYNRPRLNPKYASLYRKGSTASLSARKPSPCFAGLLKVIPMINGYCCYCKENSDGLFVGMPSDANIRAIWYARLGFFDTTIEKAMSIGDFERTQLCAEHFLRFFRGSVMYFTENFPYSCMSSATISRRVDLYAKLILEFSHSIMSLDDLPSSSINLKEYTYTADSMNTLKSTKEEHVGSTKCPLYDIPKTIHNPNGSTRVKSSSVNGSVFDVRLYQDQGFRIIKHERLDTEVDSMNATMVSERGGDCVFQIGVEVKREPAESPINQESIPSSYMEDENGEDKD